MCTMIVEKASISGSGKGPLGWFPLQMANVSYDHPFHAAQEHSLNIDFVNDEMGLGARVAVELSPESAEGLVSAINQALKRGRSSRATVSK